MPFVQVQVEGRQLLIFQVFFFRDPELRMNDLRDVSLAPHPFPKSFFLQAATVRIPDTVQNTIGAVGHGFSDPVLENSGHIAVESHEGVSYHERSTFCDGFYKRQHFMVV